MKTKPFDVILPRLFASWILVSFLNSFLSSNHLELSFIEVQQLPLFLLKGLLCFIALTLLNSTLSKHTDMIALLFGTMLYSFRVVSSSDNIFLLFGVCLFQLLILCFYEKELRQIFSSLQLKEECFQLSPFWPPCCYLAFCFLQLPAATIFPAALPLTWASLCRCFTP